MTIYRQCATIPVSNTNPALTNEHGHKKLRSEVFVHCLTMLIAAGSEVIYASYAFVFCNFSY
jgi:hypothetical protein